MPLLPAGQLATNHLNAVTTGTGTAVTLPGGTMIRECVVIVRGSAGISAGAVQLQGSVDGTNFYAIGAPITAVASTNVAQDSAFLATSVRATVSTTVVGGTVSVDLLLTELD